MSAQQAVFQFLSAGSNTLTVPPGFSNQVLVYAWGAGGGAGYNAPAGGGGGFVQGIVTVSSGDTVVISVGGQGGVGPRDGSGIGGVGDTPAISFNGGTTGVAAPYPGNDDQYYGAGGGGGAATSVLVNGVPMIVAAGGGGGGGGTNYQTGSAGLAGGVATLTSTTPRGGTSPGGYSVGGAGGAGYPFGGAGGQTFGDDAGAATGGYGGQNYANASVTSSTLTAGSGITPGGATNALYPKAKRGYAGYDGAVIVIFTKNFRAWIKDTTWKESNNAWVKVGGGSTIATRTVTVPAGSTYSTSTKTQDFEWKGSYSGGSAGISSSQTWTVPTGVTSLTVTAIGGGGASGSNKSIGSIYYGGGGGGGSGGVTVTTLSVTPGEKIRILVGNGSTADFVTPAGGEITTVSGTAGTITALGGGNGSDATLSAGGAGGIAGTGGNNGTAGSFSASGVSSYLGFGGVGGNTTYIATGSLSYGRGGSGASGGQSSGGAGFVRLTYTQTTTTTEPSTTTETYVVSTTAGGWKQINQAWVKDNNEWKSIQSGISLVPTPSTADVVTINLTIAANANNYVLSDFLSATSYYPGRSIVNLTVDAGVIVGSGTVGTPALIIDGLVSGDLLNLTNNGNIAGAGGQGGAAGQYTVTNTPIFNSKGQPVYTDSKGRIQATNSTVTSIPGRAGEIGGPALYVTYLTNLVNNGTIAGGGGGGGGGGGSTGGQGGGGAGRKAGSGANNGTLTAGGAGAGLGGAGGARGSAGSAGTNDTNTGGLGGAPGAAILGIDKVTITTAGTILGERRV